MQDAQHMIGMSPEKYFEVRHVTLPHLRRPISPQAIPWAKNFPPSSPPSDSAPDLLPSPSTSGPLPAVDEAPRPAAEEAATERVVALPRWWLERGRRMSTPTTGILVGGAGMDDAGRQLSPESVDINGTTSGAASGATEADPRATEAGAEEEAFTFAGSVSTMLGTASCLAAAFKASFPSGGLGAEAFWASVPSSSS